MNTEEYIENILKHIQNKAFINTVRQELEGHIDDRIFYYKEIGYDENTACQKAIEHMGSADKIGEEMNMLHNYKKHKIICIAGLILFTFRCIIERSEYFSVSAILSYFYKISHSGECILSCISICIFLLMAYIVYKYAFISRCRVVLFLQGAVSISISLHYIYYGITAMYNIDDASAVIKAEQLLYFFEPVFMLTCGIVLFVYCIFCLTCSGEITALIKGTANGIILKRYEYYGRFLLVFSIINTLITTAFIITYFTAFFSTV